MLSLWSVIFFFPSFFSGCQCIYAPLRVIDFSRRFSFYYFIKFIFWLSERGYIVTRRQDTQTKKSTLRWTELPDHWSYWLPLTTSSLISSDEDIRITWTRRTRAKRGKKCTGQMCTIFVVVCAFAGKKRSHDKWDCMSWRKSLGARKKTKTEK